MKSGLLRTSNENANAARELTINLRAAVQPFTLNVA